MKYIDIDHLKEAQEEVVKKIMKWWMPQKGDLAASLIDRRVQCVSYADKDKVYFVAGNCCTTWEWKTKTAPLLTHWQLIEFIESQLGEDVDIYRAGMKGHQISTEWIDGVGGSKFEFRTDTHDLLLALWECAQEVCK